MPIENDAEIRKLLEEAKVIAIVGASDNPMRDSHSISKFLMDQGYKVIPVNPVYQKILGVQCYPNLKSIPIKVDIVNVFRMPDQVLPIVEDPPRREEALEIDAPTIWMQLGVINYEAAALAEEKGKQVIMDHCIAVEHRRLLS